MALPPRAARRTAAAAGLTLAAALGLLASARGGADEAPVVDRERSAVLVQARLRLAAFDGADPPGHHLLTWSGGGAAGKALLVTAAPDVAVLDALEALGGKPGDTLVAEAWTRRDDPAHRAPDARAEGSRVALRVRLPDGAWRDAAFLLEDVDGKGYEWRLAGNRALVDVWRSGCVVCLQSCPGSKVSNARATMRDLHRGRARFRPSAACRALGEGAALTVELRLTE